VWERPYDPKLASRLLRVQCPTLLLWGDSDRLVPPAFGQAYHKYLPHAEWKTIANCGHLPMLERESEFVERVTRFCSAPWRGCWPRVELRARAGEPLPPRTDRRSAPPGTPTPPPASTWLYSRVAPLRRAA